MEQICSNRQMEASNVNEPLKPARRTRRKIPVVKMILGKLLKLKKVETASSFSEWPHSKYSQIIS